MVKARLCVLFASFAVVACAGADETLIDFTDGQFPNGEGPVTYHGVTFTNNGNGTGGPGMYGTTDWGALFSNIPGASLGRAFNDEWGNSELRLDFPEGTTQVEMLVSTGPQTPFSADFYGPSDVFLFTVEAPMPGDGQAGIILGREINGIASIRLYEPNGENFNITLVDDIRYSDERGCAPDLDGSGSLDLFDFLAFTNLYNAQDPGADWDGNGTFDLFDFLAFVNDFNAGC